MTCGGPAVVCLLVAGFALGWEVALTVARVRRKREWDAWAQTLGRAGITVNHGRDGAAIVTLFDRDGSWRSAVLDSVEREAIAAALLRPVGGEG